MREDGEKGTEGVSQVSLSFFNEPNKIPNFMFGKYGNANRSILLTFLFSLWFVLAVNQLVTFSLHLGRLRLYVSLEIGPVLFYSILLCFRFLGGRYLAQGLFGCEDEGGCTHSFSW